MEYLSLTGTRIGTDMRGPSTSTWPRMREWRALTSFKAFTMSSKVPGSGEHLVVVINSDLDPRFFDLANLCRAAAFHARSVGVNALRAGRANVGSHTKPNPLWR